MQEKYSVLVGRNDELLEEKVKISKAEVAKLPVNPSRTSFENQLAFIEISVVVHVIFIARLLNKNARLVKGEEVRKRDSIGRRVILELNIDKEMERMEKCITYFDDWRAWSKKQKDNAKETWDVE